MDAEHDENGAAGEHEIERQTAADFKARFQLLDAVQPDGDPDKTTTGDAVNRDHEWVVPLAEREAQADRLDDEGQVQRRGKLDVLDAEQSAKFSSALNL